MSTTIFNSIKELLEKANRPLLTTHVRSDGDAIGSQLALYHALKDKGKNPIIINDSHIPKVFKFLVKEPNLSFIAGKSLEGEEGKALMASVGEFDLAISVDAPTKERLGSVGQFFLDSIPSINIDHHLCNSNFSTVNWVDVNRCSTGEMVYELLRHMGCNITPRIAEALYVAIVTDTGRFTNHNTSSETLRIAAELIDCGADPTEIGNHLYKTNTYGQLLLAAKATETMKFFAGKKVATIHLTRQMLKETHTPAIDTQDFPDIPASVEGVAVGVLLRELGEPNKVKVSLRARDGVDVNRVARKFGGGGHERAAGFELTGTIHEAEDIIVKELEKALDGICQVASTGSRQSY